MKQYINYDQTPKTGLSIYYYINNFFKKVEFALLIIVCLIFIAISKNNKELHDRFSLFLVELSMPFASVVRSPFEAGSNSLTYFKELARAKSENKILKEENEKLKSIYIKALNISQENEELKELLQFINVKSTKYKSVRLISKPNQSYGTNIIINAGSKQGIKENSIITGKRSVIGRVIEVSDNISRVLTITNENSKIPVITSNSRARGILVGHNSKIMTLDYLEKGHKISTGDMVFTSGDGEHLPPGLLIGVVTKVRGETVHVKATQNPENVNLAAISNY